MKKNIVIPLTAAFVLGLSSLVYAGYEKGYVVVGTSENQVTIQKGQEEPIKITADMKRYRVGDKVKYDAENGKLRKERRPLEGC